MLFLSVDISRHACITLSYYSLCTIFISGVYPLVSYSSVIVYACYSWNSNMSLAQFVAATNLGYFNPSVVAVHAMDMVCQTCN